MVGGAAVRCWWEVVLVGVLGLGACIPAQTPPQLAATPGPAFTVTADRFTNAAFSVARPPGWRVISPGAAAAPGVIFVAPDDRALIFLTTDPQATPPQPPSDSPLREARATVPLPGATVYASVAGPVADWAAFAPVWAEVVASVGPPGG